MAKVDITDKLSFDMNPVVVIKDQELEIQSDAATMLKIMGLFQEEKGEVEAAIEAARLLFTDKDQRKIEKMSLQMKDYMVLIQEAMSLAMGGEEEAGE